MRILFISNDMIAANLAILVQNEGHEVKLFIAEKDRRGNSSFIVPVIENWKSELPWVGKDGLIVFDNVGYGKIQDRLRKQGYTVFGGSEIADKLELDREFAQKIFAEHGIQTVPLFDFDNIDDAVCFVKENPKAWVIKQNDDAPKNLNYVGYFDDGRDVVSVLKNYLQNKFLNKHRITLHEKLKGVEIGIGRYFNGKDWVGPIEFNVEYKKFFPGDIGPTTSEMGTLAWYDTDENNKLYLATLGKLKDYLKKIDFRGDFEINCIVNEKGIFPLEASPRFGSPIIHLHSEIHSSPWSELLYAIASGKPYEIKWKKGYGIVALIAVPPFPYSKKIKEDVHYGMNIYFKDTNPEFMKHVHFEGVAARPDHMNQLYISDARGYVLYATGMGDTIEEARTNTYRIVDNIVIPKMMYRNDIGLKFMNEEYMKLVKWGYLEAKILPVIEEKEFPQTSPQI